MSPRVQHHERSPLYRLLGYAPPRLWEEVRWRAEDQMRAVTTCSPADVSWLFQHAQLPRYPFGKGIVRLAPGTYRGCLFLGTDLVLDGAYTFEACVFRPVALHSSKGALTLRCCEGQVVLEGSGALTIERCHFPDLVAPSWAGSLAGTASFLEGARFGELSLTGGDYLESCSLKNASVAVWRQHPEGTLLRCDLRAFHAPRVLGDLRILECDMRKAEIQEGDATSGLVQAKHAQREPPRVSAEPGAGLSPLDTTL